MFPGRSSLGVSASTNPGSPERAGCALDGAPRHTFGSIGLYDTRMFRDLAPGTRRALTPYYREAIAAKRATGELYEGLWENVGTPAQLEALDRLLRARRA